MSVIMLTVDWFGAVYTQWTASGFSSTTGICKRLTFVQYPANNLPKIHTFTSSLQIVRIENLSLRLELFQARKSKLAIK